MEFGSLNDAKGNQLFKRAKYLCGQHDYIDALEVLEDLSFVELNDNNDKVTVSFMQGTIFNELSVRTDKIDAKVAYLLASIDNFTQYRGFSLAAAFAFLEVAEFLDSVLYYKKALVIAKQNAVGSDKKESIAYVIETAESRIAELKSSVASVVKKRGEVVKEETRKSDSDLVKRLKLYWAGLNDEVKKSFMKVSVAEFRGFVEGLYGREGRDALMRVIASAKEDRKWMFWMCRTCSKKFSSADECKNHFEQEHGAKFMVDKGNGVAAMISEAFAKKISVGGWEPVDAVAAVGMIKNQLEDVKAFVYENGWAKDWPLAVDEERSKLLHQSQLLLVSFYDCKVFSCSLQDCLMDFVVKYLGKLEVSQNTIAECLLLETPQSICFLDCDQLNQILDILKSIECEWNDGTDMVCRAVDSFCGNTRVTEKIDFDPKFSFLLLDKRLLQGKIAQYDDEGTINVFGNLNAHYAKAQAHGDDILSWLGDNTSRDETFRFPRPIRVHNLDIWVAVLKVIRYMCRTLGAKYDKKLKFLSFVATLDDTKKLCMLEDERRKNIPEDQWTLYATCICDKSEKILPKSSLVTRMDLSIVRQVLEAANDPTFDCPDSEISLSVIRECNSVGDASVLSSIDHLKTMITEKISSKVPRIDSKILLIENARTNLLNQLIRLSVFDYRSYILGPLKEFLLHGISDMESKAKIAAANAALLLEEEEKKLLSKKNKNKNKQKPSTSYPLDTVVEYEPTHTATSERSQLETSSNTDNQEEAAKRDSQLTNMAGEISMSEQFESTHGGAATRCKYALEMTLKAKQALCNIQVLKDYLVRHRDQFADNVQEQVPSALQSFFSAFAFEVIKGVYSFLLGVLLASLESKDAAELLISILEFWPCWKSPEIESVVTHLFTLEENERMSCSKCGNDRNCPEQSSYGIVMAADSIRDLKCVFEDMKFDDILKLKRMEDKMLCKKCGKPNFVHRVISGRFPFIFTIVLEWVKDETEEEISDTTKALDCEIDISRLCEGLKPDTKFRLSSMVGCGGKEGEYVCLVYKTDQWFSLRNEALSVEDADVDVVGDWENVVGFVKEKKVRLEILFYEDASLLA